MSRIELVLCDGCGHEIADGAPVTTIMVPEGDDWVMLDLCSGDCVLNALGYNQDQQELPFDEEGDDEQAPQGMRMAPVTAGGDISSEESKRRLSPDELMENEKRYREQAAELTSNITGVKSRTLGQR